MRRAPIDVYDIRGSGARRACVRCGLARDAESRESGGAYGFWGAGESKLPRPFSTNEGTPK